MEVWKCPFCCSDVTDSRNRRRLGASPSVNARVSALFQSVGYSKLAILPSDRVCKACFLSVEKLLKAESSASSILTTLQASIQALALRQTISSTQSAQGVKRGNTDQHSNPPSKRPALTPSAVSAKTTLSHAQPVSRKTLFPESVMLAVADTPDRQFLEHLSSQAEPSPIVKVLCSCSVTFGGGWE